MNNEYKFLMQRIDVPSEEINIEEYFNGLKVISCENIETIGKPKNIHIETYPESDELRVSLPQDDNYINEATKIKLVVMIKGELLDRQVVLNDFLNYIRKGKHIYRDTFFNREFKFIVIDEIKKIEEENKGDNPYMIIEIPLQNINGKTLFKIE